MWKTIRLNYETGSLDSGKDRTDPMNRPRHPSTAMNPTGGARNGHGSEAETESSCGETLFEKMLQTENMSAAWKQVRANKGAAGIDGMSVGEFPAFIRKHWERIQLKLLEGTYEPSPVKRVHIPKPDGSRRALGIPTVLDRVIQQAIAQVLSPVYEPTFSNSSYGFRPGRRAQQAIEEMQKEGNKRRPKCHVVDCDLQQFFRHGGSPQVDGAVARKRKRPSTSRIDRQVPEGGGYPAKRTV